MRFTVHALKRLKERSTLTPEDVLGAIAQDRFAYITVEKKTNRVSMLMFSPDEDQFQVLVCDVSAREIITVLSIEYWENLRTRKHDRILNQRPVMIATLVNAVRAADFNHDILKHPPLCGRSTVYFFACFRKGEKKTQQRIARATVDELTHWKRNESGVRRLRSRLMSGLGKINQDWEVSSILWKTTPGKKVLVADKANWLDFDTHIDFGAVYKAASRDARLRLANTKRYPIFDWVAERTVYELKKQAAKSRD